MIAKVIIVRMVIMIIMVVMDIRIVMVVMVASRTDTLKLDFPGNLCGAAFAILTMFLVVTMFPKVVPNM